MPDPCPPESDVRRYRRGSARRALILLVLLALVTAGPTSRRLSSQVPVDAEVRRQCRARTLAYKSMLLSYWAGADTDDRVTRILNRFVKEGPKHLDRIQARCGGMLTASDLAHIETARRAMDTYNAAPARRAAQATAASASLITIAHALDQLEAHLGRDAR